MSQNELFNAKNTDKLMKKKFTNWQRILRVMNFNYKRGLNSERVNEIYRKINLIRLEK
jgi:hypothetical protein